MDQRVSVRVYYDFASSLSYVAHRVMERMQGDLDELALDLEWIPLDLTRITGWPRGASIEGHRRELGRVSSSQVLATLPSGLDALEAAWEDGDVTWRKALVRVVLESVVLQSAVMGRNFFDPARVELVWRV